MPKQQNSNFIVFVYAEISCSQFVAEAEKASASNASPRAALLRCADLAEELEAKAARLARVQEAAIVPATAAYVTSKQQWKFNDKVWWCL